MAPPRLGKRDRNVFTAASFSLRWRNNVGEDEVRKVGRANASDGEIDTASAAAMAVVAASSFIVEIPVLRTKYRVKDRWDQNQRVL